MVNRWGSLSVLMLTLPNCVVVRKLGRGSYGEVYLAKLKSSETLVAVKCIPKTKLNKRGQDNLISEISILQDLRHPNVIRLLNFTWDSAQVYLFMEYCAGGDLSQFIRLRRRLPEPLVRRFLRQLALALQYLHRKNIIHMDLKPQNILLTSRRNPVLKVSDFGLAQCNAETVQKNELRGTLLYMAPEVYCKGIYHASCDLWSVGVILYECLFGSAPYASCDSGKLREKLTHDQAIQLPSNTPISADCAALLKGLLQRDPLKRLTHGEFFSHPFVDLEHVPSAESLDKALEFLERALDLEKRGNLKEAHEYYTRGLSNLLSAVEYETSPEERIELRQLALRYFQQAEKVKCRLDAQKAASHERPTHPPAPLLSSVSLDRPMKSFSKDGSLNITKRAIPQTQVAVDGGSSTPQTPDTSGSLATDVPSTSLINKLFNRVHLLFRSSSISSPEEINPDAHPSSTTPDDASHSTGAIKPITQITEEDLSSLVLAPPPRPPPPATFGATDSQGSNRCSKKDLGKMDRLVQEPSQNSLFCDLAHLGDSSYDPVNTKMQAQSSAAQYSQSSSLVSRSFGSNRPVGTVSQLATCISTDVSHSKKFRSGYHHSKSLPQLNQSLCSVQDADHPCKDNMSSSLPPESQLLGAVASNQAQTAAHQVKHTSGSFSRNSTFSFLKGSVPALRTLPSRPATASNKLARLRQMTTDFATKNDAVASTTTDTSFSTLPEIPARQMVLLYDMDRLRELKALCHAQDAPLLALVEHLENFYTLFRSNNYEKSLRYVQTNFGTFLSVVKGDTNEVRRRKFMKELKLVLDLTESSPQSNTETPLPQPIQPENLNPHAPHGSTTVSNQELNVESIYDSDLQTDQCSLS